MSDAKSYADAMREAIVQQAVADMHEHLAKYPLVLTVQQLAEEMQVSVDLIRDQCIAGRIHHVMLGDRRRIPRHEVYRLLSGL